MKAAAPAPTSGPPLLMSRRLRPSLRHRGRPGRRGSRSSSTTTTGLYEYRPLLRGAVSESRRRPSRRPSGRAARARRAEARAGGRGCARGAADGPAAEPDALSRGIVCRCCASTAEACRDRLGGRGVQPGLRRARTLALGTGRRYAATAPLLGLSVGGTIELARGIRVERSRRRGAGRERLARVRARAPGGRADPPRRPWAVADAITALRLATGAAVAAGHSSPSGSERHPLEPRPMLGIAATRPGGEPSRLRSMAPDARAARCWPRLPGWERGRRARPGAATLGAHPVRGRAEPLGDVSARRSPPSSAAPTGSGPRPCAQPCWSARSANPAARARVDGVLGLARGAGANAETADTCAGSTSRPCSPTTGRGCSRPSTRPCLGCARARRALFSARASAA